MFTFNILGYHHYKYTAKSKMDNSTESITEKPYKQRNFNVIMKIF